jgi:hypothetical protein
VNSRIEIIPLALLPECLLRDTEYACNLGIARVILLHDVADIGPFQIFERTSGTEEEVTFLKRITVQLHFIRQGHLLGVHEIAMS